MNGDEYTVSEFLIENLNKHYKFDERVVAFREALLKAPQNKTELYSLLLLAQEVINLYTQKKISTAEIKKFISVNQNLFSSADSTEDNSLTSESSPSVEDFSDSQSAESIMTEKLESFKTAKSILTDFWTGTESKNAFEDFMNQLETAFSICDNSLHNQLLAVVLTRIKGNASATLRTEVKPDTWEKLKAHLNNRYGEKETLEKICLHFISMTHGQKDNATTFSSKLAEAASKLKTAVSAKGTITSIPEFIDYMTNRLYIDRNSADISRYLRYTYAQYKEEPDLATLTRKAEEETEKLKMTGERSDKPVTPKQGGNIFKKSVSPISVSQKEKGKPWCSFHKVQTHWTRDCNAPQCPKCDTCGRKGYDTKDHKDNIPQKRNESSPTAIKLLSKPYCTICNISGHHTNKCQKKENDEV